MRLAPLLLRRRARARRSPAADGRGRGRAPDGRRHDHAGRRPRPQRGRRPRRGARPARPQQRPARLRGPPGDVKAMAGADARRAVGRRPRRVAAATRSTARAPTRRCSTCSTASALEDDGDPHWWQDPRSAERAVGGSATRSRRPIPRAPRATGQRPPPTRARCARSTPPSRAASAGIPPRAAQARHHPRRARLLRAPLRPAGRSAPSSRRSRRGRRRRRATSPSSSRRSAASACGRSSPRARSTPRVEDAIARETGARVGRPLWADTLGPKGSSGATYAGSIRANTRAIVEGLTGARRARSAALILDAPYLQRALARGRCCWRCWPGVLGTWIVLRRLAFYTHAVGTATFPGLVVAGPWGVAPQLAALAAALGFGGRDRAALARAPDGPRRRHRPAARRRAGRRGRPRLRRLRVRRGRRPAAVRDADRPRDRDVWLTAARRRGGAREQPALRRSWLATGFDPGSARALGRAARCSPTGCCWARSRWRWSWRSTPSARCWSPSCSSCPPRPCGWSRATCARCRLATVALAAREGVAALLAGRRARRRAGAGDGGARRRACSRSCAGGEAMTPRARRRPGGRLRGRRRRARGRRASRSSRAPSRRARPQRRRQDDAVPRAARRAAAPARHRRGRRAPGVRARRPSARGWTSR